MGSSTTLLSLFPILLIIGAVHGGWQLTLSEEFNGQSALNTSLWNVMYSFNAVINSELEYYAPDAFTFTSTTLKITGSRANVTTDLGKFSYKSGLITSKHKFAQTYGYFEMYAKVPQGIGFWPAFWLLPDAPGGNPEEIDVMEMVMNLPNNVYATYHCNYSTGGAGAGVYTNPTFSTGFHTFAVQWLPKLIIWYVDGIEIYNFSSPCIPNRPEYILANLAIGGSWPTPPNSNTPFPSYLEIDHIRAYKYVSTGGISIPGPGNGISYTPSLDPPAVLDIYNPYASPATAAPSAAVKLFVTVTINSATAYTGLNLQFVVHNLTTQLATLSTTATIPAGSPSSQQVSVTYTIPSTQQAGYLRVAFGIFTSAWSNIFWEENVIVIGVDKVVGA